VDLGVHVRERDLGEVRAGAAVETDEGDDVGVVVAADRGPVGEPERGAVGRGRVAAGQHVAVEAVGRSRRPRDRDRLGVDASAVSSSGDGSTRSPSSAWSMPTSIPVVISGIAPGEPVAVIATAMSQSAG
jgi:hypothetical protein